METFSINSIKVSFLGKQQTVKVRINSLGFVAFIANVDVLYTLMSQRSIATDVEDTLINVSLLTVKRVKSLVYDLLTKIYGDSDLF